MLSRLALSRGSLRSSRAVVVSASASSSGASQPGLAHNRGAASEVLRSWQPLQSGESNRQGRYAGLRSSWGQQESVGRMFFSSEASKSEEQHKFEADTDKLMNIVTHSLYSDREVFLRELVSNCADALEKARHYRVVNQGGETSSASASSAPLEIRIKVDRENKKIIISDNGVGMSKEDMKTLLGTIARSGSKEFVQKIKSGDQSGASSSSSDAAAAASSSSSSSPNSAASNIIGQFGVGFYSAFMVGKRVSVVSRSIKNDQPAHIWSSSGVGSFTLAQCEESDENAKGLEHGTKIIIDLRDDAMEFADENKLRVILTRYSNFVGFPIHLGDERVNTIEAIWTKQPNEVSEQSYKDFYKFCAHAFDDPLLHLHFRTDAPIDLKAILFTPKTHSEKVGMGRMQPGVSLYSRKVLLEQNSEKILPGWLRFIRGVVDSDDLPLSISRETMQDSRLITQIRNVLTKKLIRSWADLARKDKKAFEEFWGTFGHFIKEGVCSDFPNQTDISKLLRFNSSRIGPDELTSLDEYISRCEPTQDKIYYLTAPSRELAESSSYYEVFKGRKNIEVLFLYHTLDDFVMTNLGSFNGKKLVAAESGEQELGLGPEPKTKTDAEEASSSGSKDGSSGSDAASKRTLPAADVEGLREWMSLNLADVVHKVVISSRLRDSPAVIVNHESAALRRMIRMLNQEEAPGKGMPATKQELEINPNHPIMIELASLRNKNPTLANAVARQVFDGALIGAGLCDDARSVLPRLNSLLEKLLVEKAAASSSSSSSSSAPSS